MIGNTNWVTHIVAIKLTILKLGEEAGQVGGGGGAPRMHNKIIQNGYDLRTDRIWTKEKKNL